MLPLLLVLAAVDVHSHFRAEREAYSPLCTTALCKEFLAASASLKTVAPRTIYREKRDGPYGTDPYFTQKEYDALAKEHQTKLERIVAEEVDYYTTKFGTPLSYARPLDILAQHGVTSVKGKRLLDYGFGYIGHLQLLALLGAHAVGVDLDNKLRALYSEPSDQGPFGPGSVRLWTGSYPRDVDPGTGFDLIVSKNTLKRGYVHPERAADPKRLLTLGVDDETFVKALHKALAKNGKLLIYNICPAQAPVDKPFIPWADCRSPFDRALWERSGFRVVAFDENDDRAVRVMAKAYGWDQPEDGEPGMDLEHNLFAKWTLVEKR